jgi:hypothetical protein
VIEEEDMFDEFLEMIQRFPSRANQVEVLLLDNTPCINFDNRKICNIFPKARVVEITSDRINGEFVHFRKRPVELLVPKAQLVRLADYDECELALDLMATERCSRLKYLNISCNTDKDNDLHFITGIKNLPVLTELHLGGLNVTLNDMEILHNNVPTITTLTIDWFELLPSTLPLDIQPTIVTKLYIEGRGHDEDMEKQVMWLNYIQRKYPAIKEFYFWCRGNEGHDETQLLSFYEDGVLPIMKSLGSQVVSMPSLCIPLGLNVFKRMDEYGCKLRECRYVNFNSADILDEMARSAQAKHIHKMHVIYLPETPFTWLSSMKNLRDLDLQYSHVSINEYNGHKPLLPKVELNVLLTQCPDTLETLTIRYSQLILKSTNDTYAASSVKKLKLLNVLLPPGSDKYIARYFPLLTSLHLDGCIFSNGKFSLPNHHLSCLEVATRDKENVIIDMSLKTEKHVQPRLYPTKSQGLFMSLYKGNEDVYINPTDYELTTFPDNVRTRVYLQLEAASVKSLIVNRLHYSTD